MTDGANASDLLSPREVARLFRVDPSTVTRWAKSGKLSSIRTIGGHRRYRRGEIEAWLSASNLPAPRAGGDSPDAIEAVAPTVSLFSDLRAS